MNAFRYQHGLTASGFVLAAILLAVVLHDRGWLAPDRISPSSLTERDASRAVVRAPRIARHVTAGSPSLPPAAAEAKREDQPLQGLRQRLERDPAIPHEAVDRAQPRGLPVGFRRAVADGPAAVSRAVGRDDLG